MSSSSMNGYVVCLHTCKENGCINPKTTSILWPRGSSAFRHGCTEGRTHPNCNEDCPGKPFLGLQAGRTGADTGSVRAPTAAELSDNLDSPIYVKRTTTEPSAGPHRPRQIRVLYVADPVNSQPNKARALLDHAFVKAKVDVDEWEAIQHLHGHVHRLGGSETSVRVVVQEWVGPTTNYIIG